MEWVQFSCFFRLACLPARVCFHDGLGLMSLSVLSLYPLLFFLAFQIWEMSLLPFLSFFFLSFMSRSQTARSQMCQHSYRLIVMLYLYQPLICSLSSLSFSVGDSATKVKRGYNWIVRPRRVTEDAKDVLKEPETMFRKHMQDNMSQDAYQRFGQSKTP